MADTQTTITPTPYEDMSLKQLQGILTEMDFVGADLLPNKAACIAVITSFKEKEAKNQKAVDEAAEKARVDALAANPAGVATPVVSPAQESKEARSHESKRIKMKKWLDSQPKEGFVVPLEFGEKPGAYETVVMNGHRMNIMKGVRVSLPIPVINHLLECYNMTAIAGGDYKLDRDEKVTERLNLS